MVETTKQVRVDNWGIFFLQRLQLFFSKTDYCDLTLQFEGNVQLKVHRLVMNACTEYFTYLEQQCPAVEENTIMMPSDLQADVIVPIVNFMYTGMLEYHPNIFEKLYKAAELMNITVLMKLLDAQITPASPLRVPKKKNDVPHTWNLQGKKISAKSSSELPATLPGRKLPVWKRKTVPTPLPHPVSATFESTKWSSAPPQDPLSLPDNTPKPTRFEWPDDDLPQLNLMDTTFDISYTSKPLLTKEEEQRAGTSTEEPSIKHSKRSSTNGTYSSADMKDVEDYVKEQKIRSDLNVFDEEMLNSDHGIKRKTELTQKLSPKRIKIAEKEKETTISIKSNNAADLDHTKIVSEILKKYPGLVKKNKNIRLKIMAAGSKNENEQKILPVPKTQKVKVQVSAPIEKKIESNIVQTSTIDKQLRNVSEEGPWTCDKCITDGESQEFVLYYLYRKHMTDVHNEAFDPQMCKYCGKRCETQTLMMYHLNTKHGLKPPSSYSFPKCDSCPFIAINNTRMSQHKQTHGPDEMQCLSCKLGFISQVALAAHIQITGHNTKTSATDCQYCMKKLQSTISLFSHIKSQHLKEGRRDGIVSLDESMDIEEIEDTQDEEFLVPGMLNAQSKDKVNILSNVEVPVHQEVDGASNQQLTTSGGSLNNVTGGIATSLGLVDIVVLDDNQQYILQQQQNHGGEAEFILPELSASQAAFNPQVITTQHNTVQGMLQTTGTDINSTDELVMVLTDHDYQDEEHHQDQTDNSNIVVLYSHPVDGQQGQFITSQGNLLVNSQTGLLEIRNGTPMTTTSGDSIVVAESQNSQVESIEMIQREIENHQMKNAPFIEENKIELTEEQQLNTAQPQPQEETTENPETSETPQEEPAQFNQDTPDGDCIQEEPMEVENDVVENTVEERLQTAEEDVPSDTAPTEEHEVTAQQETPVEQDENKLNISGELLLNDPSGFIGPEDASELIETPEQQPVESTEVDGVKNIEENNTEEPAPEPETTETKPEEEEKEEKSQEPETEAVTPETTEREIPPEKAEETVTEDEQNEKTQPSEGEETQNDEDSQSSQETPMPEENQQSSEVNRAILEDWDDTDSQQSDKQQKTDKNAAESVNKLMDDWEEEEEEKNEDW